MSLLYHKLVFFYQIGHCLLNGPFVSLYGAICIPKRPFSFKYVSLISPKVAFLSQSGLFVPNWPFVLKWPFCQSGLYVFQIGLLYSRWPLWLPKWPFIPKWFFAIYVSRIGFLSSKWPFWLPKWPFCSQMAFCPQIMAFLYPKMAPLSTKNGSFYPKMPLMSKKWTFCSQKWTFSLQKWHFGSKKAI